MINAVTWGLIYIRSDLPLRIPAIASLLYALSVELSRYLRVAVPSVAMMVVDEHDVVHLKSHILPRELGRLHSPPILQSADLHIIDCLEATWLLLVSPLDRKTAHTLFNRVAFNCGFLAILRFDCSLYATVTIIQAETLTESIFISTHLIIPWVSSWWDHWNFSR